MTVRQASARSIRLGGLLDVLRLVHAAPGTTRADLARDLGLSRSTASELAARLRALALVEEGAAPTGSRGRPTLALGPHPDGPVVAAVDISHESWRLAVGSLGGALSVLREERHRPGPAGPVLAGIAAALAAARDGLGDRLRAVAVAVPATVAGGRLVQASGLDWHDVDVADRLRAAAGVPVAVGNDATLAGVAEARRGAAVGVGVALYLAAEVGVGGVLLDHGRPVASGTGAGGEFGHLPFGDPGRACPCGARGCWDSEADARALVRHAGGRPGPAPRTAASRVLAGARAGDPAARAAVDRVAASLGGGVAGLVNALDPEVVTLSGLAVDVLGLAGPAVRAAYRSGLMRFRRAAPPPLVVARFPADGSLRGAAELGFDRVLCDAGLDAWQAVRTGGSAPEPPGADAREGL